MPDPEVGEYPPFDAKAAIDSMARRLAVIDRLCAEMERTPPYQPPSPVLCVMVGMMVAVVLIAATATLTVLLSR